MKRLILLISILLLVGGAGGAFGDAPSPELKSPAVAPQVKVLPDYQAKVGDLIALGPLIPDKLREVCAIVGFTPKVKPEMTGAFCYPSTEKGTPARNGYINIFLSWGGLTAPGGGRWTGTKIARLSNSFNFADYRSRGWSFWNPPEAWPLWQELVRKNGIASWPEPVFTKSQLAGKITKVVNGDPSLGDFQGFKAGQEIGVGPVGEGPFRAISCGFEAGDLGVRVNGEQKQFLECSPGPLSDVSPYPYVLKTLEPFGPQNVRLSRDPACGCYKAP